VELTSEGTRLAMQTYSDVTARMARLVDRVPREEQERLAVVVKTINDGKRAASGGAGTTRAPI
jgi:hypothetical protein